jgi:phage/plasmid-associated DNA primase
MIFADNAPEYWKRGLPVIPLKQNDKMPLTDGWQYYAEKMPSLAEQEYWLKAYPLSNIGIVLGPQSGLCMVDIDSTDEAIKDVIMQVLSPCMSPWQRIGSKGMALAFKQPVSGPLKTFRIKKAHPDPNMQESQTIVELLSTRTQIVLPPSIHPDTKRPYIANCELLDILDDLPHIPREIENLLRQALLAHGVELSHSGWTRVTDYVSLGSRDNQMIKVAGLWAQGVTRGELSLKEAIERMAAWHESCVEKIAGDELDIQKGVSSLIGFLVRDVLERKKTLPKGWDAGIDDETKKKYGLEFTIEHEEWSYDQLIAYMTSEFSKSSANTDAWMETASYVLDRISRSESLDPMRTERLLRFIHESSGKQLTMSVLKTRVRESRQGEIKGMDHTEIAKAVIEDVSSYGELRFHTDTFWQWSGSHWRKVDREDLMRIVADKFGSLPAAKKRGDHTGIVSTMGTLCTKELRTDPRCGINFANGYVTEELRILPHDPSYGCTYTMPYRYLPEESDRAKRFQTFLDRCWTNDEAGPDIDITEKKMALEELMAATMFGVGTRYARVALLYGMAGTGKSQLLNIVEALMPPEVVSALKPEMWGDKFGPSALVGKLLNIAGELSEKDKIAGDSFKQIVDGSSIEAQRKNGPLFHFRPQSMHWFASNHLPKSADTSAGFNRRWLIIGFWNKISREERIADLANQIVAEEREQIAAWAVRGITRLLKNNDYTLPKSHEEHLQDVAHNNDSVRYWVEASAAVRVDPFGREAAQTGSKSSPPTSETQLYEAYSGFSLNQGVARPVTLRTFQMRMKEIAEEKGLKKVMIPLGRGMEESGWKNITLVR